MDIFIFIMIFIAGTVFGSFYSLAVYRIPRKENITYVQSHCVSCNHKLGLMDLIPIWSYIFLKGRCRYCKEKIRSRYVLLEVTSGFTFLLIALFLKINVYSSILEFINLFVIYLFVTAVFIIGGIDKEHHIIPDSLILYLSLISILKIIVNAFMEISAISNIIGFLVIPIILLIINLVLSKLNKENFKISFGIIKYLAFLGLFFGFKGQIIIILFMLITVGIVNIFHKYEKIPFGFYISVVTILYMIFGSYLSNAMSLIFIC